MFINEEVTIISESIKERCQELDKSEPCATKDLFPPEVWNEWGEGVRRRVGRIVSHLATNGLLPLKHNGKRANNHNIYYLV